MLEPPQGPEPHALDVHLGRRLRAMRRQAGLSLQQMAAEVGVAFQQLQKYETGANRMSAAMVYRLAHALGRPVAAFYEGLLDPSDPSRGTNDLIPELDAIIGQAGGRELLQALCGLPPHVQPLMLELARAFRSCRAPAR
jgi:transcriptional regulator with XRE-family HTH domain